MSTPGELQRDVIAELDFDPRLDGEEVGVSVTGDGIVTLNGRVRSYAGKLVAERAAKRVAGVKGVANDLAVDLRLGTERDDTEIARAAVRALEWNTELAHHGVRVTVKDGLVTLEGVLDWEFQRNEARRAVEHLMGVRGVLNLVTLRHRVLPQAVEERLRAAFGRGAGVDAHGVRVGTIGGRVILTGTVRSWTEHAEVERAAWSVPGVTQVENNLVVATPRHAAA